MLKTILKQWSDFRIKAKSKKYWKRGGGEMLGFVCITPFIILLICAVVAAAQVSITNQTLNFAAYNAGRSAVVCDSLTTAQNRANNVYELELGLKNSIENSYVPCEITLLDGAQWGKGSYIRCTVRYYIATLMPFTSGVREQSIVMMIENGDSDT